MSYKIENKCYLINSNAFTKEVLSEDTIDLWYGLMEESYEKMSDYFKQGISDLIIQYKISFMKYTLNSEYFETPIFLHSSFDQYLYIAPSLKIVKQRTKEIPYGCPLWFVYAFPDVVLWCMSKTGQDVIFKIVQKNSKEEELSGKYISLKSLKDFIEFYLKQPRSFLECQIFNLK